MRLAPPSLRPSSSPPARPGGFSGRRDALLAQLADRIRRIEQGRPEPGRLISPREAGGGGVPATPSLTPPSPPLAPDDASWSSGDAAVDACLAPFGLDEGATYEIKPRVPEAGASLAACQGAAQSFALRLAIGRCRALAGIADALTRRAPLLWCTTVAQEREAGRPYGPGLGDLGLDPARLVLASAPKAQDALWIAEEALKAESFAAIVLLADEVALTPARRLALAARAHRTPCLLVTRHDATPAASVLYRWRVGPAVSGPHRFEAKAPGAPRLAVEIERIRARPSAGEGLMHVVEWSDETRCFRVAAGVAARPAAEDGAWRRAG